MACPKLHPDDIISTAKGDKFVDAVCQTHPELKHLSLCASPRPVRVFENVHPEECYWKSAEVSFSWADKVTLTFDPRSDLVLFKLNDNSYYLNAGSRPFQPGEPKKEEKAGSDSKTQENDKEPKKVYFRAYSCTNPNNRNPKPSTLTEGDFYLFVYVHGQHILHPGPWCSARRHGP